ncbi:50S ribosomal protein L11 methyltransferase [Raineya orbicola]|uniref:Ribosomal protein L11 methyltransferase n=1 Tax=Raineya orbicola TaxID=2016530 RepID=A0A2N3IHR5_9BACT|nr:50S ribosomal protein L11 methyltransferase [Raineya orbicola]PKQ69869.1 Ribosomal protein L11 methylase [Raineya orbicola]
MFIELIVEANPEAFEIFIAELADLGYDSFMEEQDILKAYILAENFDEEAIKMLEIEYAKVYPFRYTFSKLEKVNWNETWEKNYEPVEIADKVRIRAIFHEPKPKNFNYEIIITPKMSFGTGHHATTSLMIENQLEINHQGKDVLDAGTGTGILAIMAKLLGASYIEAFDTDEWAVENSRENTLLNDCSEIVIYQGDISAVDTQKRFDIVLANINKNVLLADIPAYSQLLKIGGFLLLSGFYEEDLTDIQQKCKENSLQFVKEKNRNKWVSAVFEKV